MKAMLFVVAFCLLTGCTSVVHVENGATLDDCTSRVEIGSTGITTINSCSDGESVTKIEVG